MVLHDAACRKDAHIHALNFECSWSETDERAREIERGRRGRETFGSFPHNQEAESSPYLMTHYDYDLIADC